MRSVVVMLLSTLSLGGCGNREDIPTVCEIGPHILREARDGIPGKRTPCSRDEDCVRLFTNISCPGIQIGTCGEIVHRSAAESWNPNHVCDRISEESVPSDYECSVQPSCTRVGEPTCLFNICVDSNEVNAAD